jgi:hypothetical protein
MAAEYECPRCRVDCGDATTLAAHIQEVHLSNPVPPPRPNPDKEGK